MVTALFRTKGDFAGLSYYSNEPGQHIKALCPFTRNYSGTKLAFTFSMTGNGVAFSNITHKPSLTIVSGDEEYYITLGFLGVGIEASSSVVFEGDTFIGHPWVKWGSETVTYSGTEAVRGTDYTIDYVDGTIKPVEGGSIPYGATVSISYTYSSTSNYEIDFDNLYEGEHPNIAERVLPYAIDKVMFPIYDQNYIEDDMTYTGQSEKVVFNFTNWTVTGGNIGNPQQALPVNNCQFAEGYDDEYYQNPQRIIDVMYHLGYRGSIDLYIGASHYYDFYGITGTTGLANQRMITDATKGINAAFEEWLRYFCRAARSKGYTEIVLSISMESLHVPDGWRQKMYNGDPGQSGWAPPTSFYSPTNPDVRSWYNKVCRNILDIAVSEQMPPVLQLGEPWWWWQEFMPGDVTTPYPGRPPCFYDDYTVALYQSEFGVALPTFQTSEIDMSQYGSVIRWLRDQLGAFSDYVKSIVKSYTNGKYLILFFPPSVLDTERTPEAIRTVNVPKTQWDYPSLDRIQIEDYDWLIHENPEHPNIFTFANTYFGYPMSAVDYFSGFAWDKYTVEDERYIKKYEPGRVIEISSVSTEEGSALVTIQKGKYVDAVTYENSPYNAVVLRSEGYHAGDKIYVTNAGVHGMAVAYVDNQYNTPTLVNWVEPGQVVCLVYNGWNEDPMWSYTIVSNIVADGILYSEDGDVLSDIIPMPYQWGLIENAARWGRKHSLPVYLWAGTQIRRDSYIPDPLYYECTPYAEDNSTIKTSTIKVENNGEAVSIGRVFVETGWKATKLKSRR